MAQKYYRFIGTSKAKKLIKGYKRRTGLTENDFYDFNKEYHENLSNVRVKLISSNAFPTSGPAHRVIVKFLEGEYADRGEMQLFKNFFYTFTKPINLLEVKEDNFEL